MARTVMAYAVMAYVVMAVASTDPPDRRTRCSHRCACRRAVSRTYGRRPQPIRVHVWRCWKDGSSEECRWRAHVETSERIHTCLTPTPARTIWAVGRGVSKWALRGLMCPPDCWLYALIHAVSSSLDVGRGKMEVGTGRMAQMSLHERRQRRAGGRRGRDVCMTMA